MVDALSRGVTPVAGTRYRLRLESSADLRIWRDEGEWDTLAPDDDGLAVVIEPQRFYRLKTEAIETTGETPDGAELYGYGRIFGEELKRVGYRTPAEFAADQPEFGYLEKIDFDPTTAHYWERFNADPAVVNVGREPTSPGYRAYDFRLNAAEAAIFQTNGFVVSERLGADRFAEVYYRLFNDDLPVFVTADSVLHAWHYSFQRLLEESEELQLARALQTVLLGMREALFQMPPSVRNGPLAESITDADYYLAVGSSLICGSNLPPILAGTQGVMETLAAIEALQFVPEFPLFGATRPVDFSQFAVRGHYTRNPTLGRYFRAFMWVARIDLRVLGRRGDPQSLRELGTAVVLANLLQSAQRRTSMAELDAQLRFFIGRADSMDLIQLHQVLWLAGLTSLSEHTSIAQIADLQALLDDGSFGEQLYTGDVFYSPFGPEQTQLPASFAVLGQRFVPDGWAISQVTFDRIRWFEDIPQVTFFRKVLRRYASALDVVYATLGNRQVGDLIAARMLDASGRGSFRDGYPYAHNLTALAATFERLPAAAWGDSIYTRWLAALRALSAPTTGTEYPQAMRTRAWARHTLNTQLASYTELKHDTVLYAKQPYTGAIICEYPAGFVEPVPAFWRRMKELAEGTATALTLVPALGEVTLEVELDWGGTYSVRVDLKARKEARIAFCAQFAETMAKLEELARKELAQQPFTDADILFIRGLMNSQDHEYFGRSWDGWYPDLFYKDYGQLLEGSPDSNGSNQPDPLVTDIHTAPPDLSDPAGGVLHEATGNVDMLMIAVDSGPDRMVYAGPTLSHYEFMVPGPTLRRLTDEEWMWRGFPGSDNPWPARPEWTRSYLVPASAP